MKTCTKCGEVKALDAFHKNSTRKDGICEICKACVQARGKTYRAANSEKIAATAAAYRAANIDAEVKRWAAYRAANREKQSTYKAAYRLANIEMYRARNSANKENLTPCYIAHVMRIKTSELTPGLYELKREQLETRRLAKQLKQATKDEHASI